MLVVGAESGVQSVKDLVASASASAGKCFYASPGSGTANYLNTEQFLQAMGIKAQHVGYKGKMESLIEFASSRAYFTCVSMAALWLIQDGKRVAIAQLFQQLPGVPLIAEVVPAWARNGSQIIPAPAGTPIDIPRQLSREIARIPALRDIKTRLGSMVFLATTGTSEDCERDLRSDIATFATLRKVLRLRTMERRCTRSISVLPFA